MALADKRGEQGNGVGSKDPLWGERGGGEGGWGEEGVRRVGLGSRGGRGESRPELMLKKHHTMQLACFS